MEKQPTKSPAISIIVAAFNASKTILTCISSVLNTATREIELIVVDDCSKDDTLAIIRSFDCDPRLKVIALGSNLGVSAARNIGIRNASGKWIAFLDSDDELPETAIYNMLQEIPRVDSDARLIVGSYMKNSSGTHSTSNHGIDRDFVRNTSDIIDYLRDYSTAPYIYTLLVHCWGKLYCTNILRERELFSTEMTQLEDVELNFRYLLSCEKIQFTKNIFYLHNIGLNGLNLSAQSGGEKNAVKNIMTAYHSVDIFLKSQCAHSESDRIHVTSNLYINTLIIWINRISRRTNFRNLLSSYRSIGTLLASDIASRKNLKYYKYRQEHSVLMLVCLWLKSPPLIMAVSYAIAHSNINRPRPSPLTLTRNRAES